MRLGDKKNKIENHGFFEINSYGISQALINLNTGAFGAYVFFFLETELHLNIIFLMVIFIIYSIWDAINEPYIGNLSDRTNKFTKKWGRRLPWIIVGIFLWPIFYILIFLTPNIGSTPILGLTYMYVLIILILYDLFYTLWSVNSEALFPYKFRDLQERRKVSGIRGFWGIIGLTLGFIIPPLIIEYNIKETYILQAVILGVITIIGGVLMIPGHKEEQEIIENYLEFKTNHEIKKNSFFKNLFSTLKKKNFVIMIILHFTYTVMTALLIISLNYFIKYNLKLEEESLIIGLLGYIIFSIISIPLWIKIAKKINNNKNMMTIGAISMSLATFPLFFANNLIALFVKSLYPDFSFSFSEVRTFLLLTEPEVI